jgi:hypothetical protein
VIGLTITDFIMFPELDGQVISRFVLREKTRLIAYPHGDVELVFVELTKFTRELEELRNLTDEWIFFVQRAAELSEIPPNLGEVPEIEAAFEIAEAARLTAEEDHTQELKTRWIADQRLILAAKAEAESRAEQERLRAEQEIRRAELIVQRAVAALVEKGLSEDGARQLLKGDV